MISTKNIVIVLVEPRNSQNIGAVARAMKTMGFCDLYLVNPAPYMNGETYYTAWDAQEILENASCFVNLETALKGVHFVIGTTQRKRKRRDQRLSYAPHELSTVLKKLSSDSIIALVFGRETNGLLRNELAMCHAITAIPQFTKHPSCNLSHAVMIYCYELCRSLHTMDQTYTLKTADFTEIQMMHEHFDKIFRELPFYNEHLREEFSFSMKRILNKIPLESRDVATFHSFLNLVEKTFYPVHPKEISQDSSRRRTALTKS